MPEKNSKGKWFLIGGVIVVIILVIVIIANGGAKNAGDKFKNKADSLQNSINSQ